MLTHDLLLSFSGPVSWDISCFHQPLSFVQQQLACHLAATLLWMCPPFACSCCTWARQSVQILPALSLSFTFVQSVARWISAHTAFHFMPWILFKLLWSLSLSPCQCSGASCTEAKSGLVRLPNSSHCVWLVHFVHVPLCSECLIVVCSLSPTCWVELVQRLQAVCTV